MQLSSGGAGARDPGSASLSRCGVTTSGDLAGLVACPAGEGIEHDAAEYPGHGAVFALADLLQLPEIFAFKTA